MKEVIFYCYYIIVIFDLNAISTYRCTPTQKYTHTHTYTHTQTHIPTNARNRGVEAIRACRIGFRV
jgi:hypothetical protein